MTALEHLPVRVDALAVEISQLRTEMRGEFSAVRADMSAQAASIVALRGEIAQHGASIVALRAAIGSVSTQMRVLHEEVISRIALVQESRSKPSGRKRRKT